MWGCLKMGRRRSWVAGFVIFLLVFVRGSSSSFVAAASTASPARMVNVFFSRALSALLKWARSLKSTTKTAISGRPMMRFESGYTVETVFDGSKLGIEPYSVEVSPTGELLVLDSVNSNIYKIHPSPSRYSRPKLVAGSAEGYSGHVDGKPREARMNHPKGFTVDDRGNIYVADAMNMAIRKISDTGVTTIAGGKWNRGHADGPSEDAKFSTDFEVVYIGSSCSLLVIDRGNRAIREIQLNFEDCAYQYGFGFSSGVAILLGACFFGYMLALLQRRVGVMVSPNKESESPAKPSYPPSPYKKLPKPSSVRSPLIPPEDESEKQDEGLFTSFGKLISGTVSFMAELFGGIFPCSRKKSNVGNQEFQYQYLQQQRQLNTWPVQDSYVVPNEDEPPPLESRTTPRKAYGFMANGTEKIRHFRQARPFVGGWQGEQMLQQQRHYPLGAQTYYQQSCDSAKEIVFGAIQESDMRAPVEIKAVDYGDPMYGQGMRSRISYGGYWHAY